MKNIKSTIEYVGTNYEGFQSQKNGKAVQNIIENAIKKALGEEVKIFSSGRTDAGVHAINQVINFFSDTKISLSNLHIVINKCLPTDIYFKKCEEVPFIFDSRKTAKKKTYLYKVNTQKEISVFDKPFMYHINKELDYSKMNLAIKFLLGEHDFVAFMSSGSSVKKTVRKIYNAKIEKTSFGFEFIIEGSGFLYNMVRIIIGTLIDVGEGKKDTDIFKTMIDKKQRNLGGKTLPAHGLYLQNVEY